VPNVPRLCRDLSLSQSAEQFSEALVAIICSDGCAQDTDSRASFFRIAGLAHPPIISPFVLSQYGFTLTNWRHDVVLTVTHDKIHNRGRLLQCLPVFVYCAVYLLVQGFDEVMPRVDDSIDRLQSGAIEWFVIAVRLWPDFFSQGVCS
jgi:hypothetical protein